MQRRMSCFAETRHVPLEKLLDGDGQAESEEDVDIRCIAYSFSHWLEEGHDDRRKRPRWTGMEVASMVVILA